MEDITVALHKREVTGKSVKHLRAEGQVPAVIHDHGKASVVVVGQYADLLKTYQRAGKHHPVEVTADGKHYTALIKSVEFDPRKHQLRHVVFNAVKANEKVTAEVPVRIKLSEGNESTPAERAGLVVLEQLDAVEIEAVPSKLPQVLEFDGEKLVEVGDHATVADLIIPQGVTVKTDASHPLATVFEPAALEAANNAAAGTSEAEAPGEAASEGSPEATAEPTQEK
jgi:large subunit ribosomal protein L25